MKSPLTSLEDLYQALEAHDWSHMMSDDPRVYQAGSNDAKRINNAARHIDGGKDLVEAFHKYRWTPGSPKPFIELPQVKKTFKAMVVKAHLLDEAADWCGGSVKGTKLPPEQRVIQLHGGGDWRESEAKVGDYVVELCPYPARYMAFSPSDYAAIFCSDHYAVETP